MTSTASPDATRASRRGSGTCPQGPAAPSRCTAVDSRRTGLDPCSSRPRPRRAARRGGGSTSRGGPGGTVWSAQRGRHQAQCGMSIVPALRTLHQRERVERSSRPPASTTTTVSPLPSRRLLKPPLPRRARRPRGSASVVRGPGRCLRGRAAIRVDEDLHAAFAVNFSIRSLSLFVVAERAAANKAGPTARKPPALHTRSAAEAVLRRRCRTSRRKPGLGESAHGQ